MDYLCDCISNVLFKSSMFLNSLKLADVKPLHKKGIKELKEDCRSVCILSTLSKMFESIMFLQIYASFDNAFSKYQCGFRKGYSTQHCNLKMLEKWKNMSEKEKISVFYSQTSQRHLIVSTINYSHTNLMITALIFQHYV